MSDNSKLILKKLVALAEKQQKILVKLAQAAQDDSQANIQYLKGAWQTAGLNSGLESVSTPQVTYTPGSTTPDGITIGENYSVKGEVPVNKKELMLRNFQNQIKSQKPELDGKVSTFLPDPTVKQPA